MPRGSAAASWVGVQGLRGPESITKRGTCMPAARSGFFQPPRQLLCQYEWTAPVYRRAWRQGEVRSDECVQQHGVNCRRLIQPRPLTGASAPPVCMPVHTRGRTPHPAYCGVPCCRSTRGTLAGAEFTSTGRGGGDGGGLTRGGFHHKSLAAGVGMIPSHLVLQQCPSLLCSLGPLHVADGVQGAMERGTPP